MANQEHLNKLKEGVEAWNQWRHEHMGIQPDLKGADLRDASFRSAILYNADLSFADLNNANLSHADLKGANLIDTNLRSASFNNADLSFADLNDADLYNANLSHADLHGANLSHTDLHSAILYSVNLIGAILYNADLSNTMINWTTFGNVDLSTVKGLETVIHDGPSIIGIDTIYLSQGKIPEIFLKGAGVNDTFITYIHSLVGKPIEYYSCFISYSSKDEPLAKRLYADLQSHNVRCWFAPEDLKWGEKIRTGIDEAIRLHDKLLLILSKSSVASGWVEHEVKAALAKERKEKRVTLFPVRVDKAVLESPLSWATEIRHERNIGDFTRWKTHDEYEKAFARLLRDLKADSHQTEGKGE